MWQEITVYSIGILTLVYVGVKVYRFFHSVRKPEMNSSCTCAGCPGCQIRK